MRNSVISPKSFLVAVMLHLAVAPASVVPAADVVAGRSLAEWTAELQTSSPVARRRGVLSIGAFGKSAVPVLTKALAHEDAVVR